MAGTLNFINDMNKDAIIFWGSLFVWWIVLSAIIISMTRGCINKNSSPIERISHDEIITVVDSILDARFNSGCCEEDTDIVSISSNRRLISAEKFADITE